MTDKERMLAGLVYDPAAKEILDEQNAALEKLYEYNNTRPSDGLLRKKLLKEMFAEIGEGCYIEPPFHANWGGKHVHFGINVYANFNLTLVDDGDIYVGDRTKFGPNVVVATASHPVNPSLRKFGYQYNAPIHIGKNCWIGAGALILPGVTIGDNTVIGAGSVVTKDVPSDVVAFGNPCRLIRDISVRDDIYYFRENKIDWENLDVPNEEEK